MLADVAVYQVTTNDTLSATADVELALTWAQERLEGDLGRPDLLEYGDHTETLLVRRDGNLYPTCWPVAASDSLRVIGDVIYAPTPDSFPSSPGGWPRCEPDVATVTYQGGFDPAATEGRHVVPRCIRDDLCWAAWSRLHPDSSTALPAGATSVSSGDESITFGSGGVATAPQVRWSRHTLAYGRRP